MNLFATKTDEQQTGPRFYLEGDFYKMAPELRTQFEKQILKSVESRDGLTPLGYAFRENVYQFLTSGSERIFTRESLDDLTSALKTWSLDALGASYVSTPQTRVYVNGCWRDIARDDVRAEWHYLISLSQSSGNNVSRIKIVEDVMESAGDGKVAVARVVSVRLAFNQLLVHRTRVPYGIGPVKGSMNPLQGAIFLDGYMW